MTIKTFPNLQIVDLVGVSARVNFVDLLPTVESLHCLHLDQLRSYTRDVKECKKLM